MEICHYGNTGSRKVLIQRVDDHDLSFLEQKVLQIARLTENADFLLIAVKVNHWNDDLSTWAAPPVYGREGFGDGGRRPSLPSPTNRRRSGFNEFVRRN